MLVGVASSVGLAASATSPMRPQPDAPKHIAYAGTIRGAGQR